MSKLRKKILLLLGFLILFLLAVEGYSFSFYQGQVKNQNYSSNFHTSFISDYDFSSYVVNSNNEVNTKIIFDISEDNMNSSHSSTSAIQTDSRDLKLFLVNYDRVQDITCGYDVVWKWDESSDTYRPSATGIKEFTVAGQNLNEINLDYDKNEDYFTLYHSSLNAPAGGSNSSTESLSLNFYNIANINQIMQAGKKYSGSFQVKNVSCNQENPIEGSLASLIVNNAVEENEIPNDVINQIVHEKYMFNDTVVDAGYRFEGTNPDNYLRYNNELFRIIGTFHTELGWMTKIVRASSDVNIAFSNNDIAANYWPISSLYRKYEREFGSTTYLAMYPYKLGGTANFNNLKASEWFTIENTTGKYSFNWSNSYKNYKSLYYGLLMPSDYMFAVLPTICSRDKVLASDSTQENSYGSVTNCTQKNWLVKGKTLNELMMISNSDNTSEVYVLKQDSTISKNDALSSSSTSSRLVLYLKSTVAVTGSGSITNPFIIS